jgi:3-phosphoshikimate 1-carboxyvinyltransferase
MDIYGGDVTGGFVESHNDHRIAMACAIAALRARSAVTINGFRCVSKSYPEFFDDIETLRAST